MTSKMTDLAGNPIKKEVTLVSWDPVSAEKGGYAHFMLKEIHEQPSALRDTVADRIKDGKIHFDELNMDETPFKKIQPRRLHRLRDQLARGAYRRIPDRAVREDPVRGGIRGGVPLQASRSGREYPCDCDQPVRRNGRHDGRDMGSKIAGSEGHSHLQR